MSYQIRASEILRTFVPSGGRKGTYIVLRPPDTDIPATIAKCDCHIATMWRCNGQRTWKVNKDKTRGGITRTAHRTRTTCLLLHTQCNARGRQVARPPRGCTALFIPYVGSPQPWFVVCAGIWNGAVQPTTGAARAAWRGMNDARQW